MAPAFEAPKLHRPVYFIRRTRRHRIPIDHEQHGEPGVLAHETNDLDDAAFADQRLRGLEANNPQQSWGFDGEPPEAVIKESGTRDGTS
jgi:hypothetical protein